MTRLPIRLRVTLAFAAAMAVVLSVIGLAVYARFQAQLDGTIDDGLRSRIDDVRPLARAGSGLARDNVLIERGESFAQILALDGRVLDGPPRLRSRALLAAADVRRAARGPIFADRENPFERGEPARILAAPVQAGDRRVIAVVGRATDDRADALASLARLLALGGPVALLLAALAGYGVASAALRPVEQMRRKAAEITDHVPGERLPVTGSDDEIARLGTTLNDMLERLELAFERERAFVADASHELRTPLAILKTEIELALAEGRSPAQLIAALRSAGEETDRLAELADALLVLASADGGRLAVTPRELRVTGLLEGVRDRFAARVHDSGRLLVVEPGAPDLHVLADPRRLDQALDNLVENALRHGAGTISLAAVGAGDSVELRVSDEGPGFPPAFLDQAFDRFTRADPARARGGSGLGLSIVQLLARAQGGDARAQNEHAGGARVSVVLPACGAGSRPSPVLSEGRRNTAA